MDGFHIGRESNQHDLDQFKWFIRYVSMTEMEMSRLYVSCSSQRTWMEACYYILNTGKVSQRAVDLVATEGKVTRVQKDLMDMLRRHSNEGGALPGSLTEDQVLVLDVTFVETWSYQRTVLYWAVKRMMVPEVKFLLQQGANVLLGRCDGESPLHKAAGMGIFGLVELLLEYGADVNAETQYGETPLMRAIGSAGSEDYVVRLLLRKGASVKMTSTSGNTALKEAARSNRIDLVQLVLDHGARVDDPNHADASILFSVTQDNIGKVLLDAGADVNIRDGNGENVLFQAVKENNLDLAALWINHHVDLNTPNNEGQVPLLYAAQHGGREMIRLLVVKGASTDVTDVDGNTLLVHACRLRLVDLARIIITQHPDVVNTQNYEGETALYVASKNLPYSYELVQLLLQAGADPRLMTRSGRTPLHNAFIRPTAAEEKETPQPENLFELFADVQFRRRKEDIRVVQMLVDAGVPIDAMDENRRTALHEAIEYGSDEAISFLVNSGAMSIADKEGMTPFLMAAKFDRVDLVRWYLYAGESIDQRNQKKQTALHLATESKNPQVVELLIQRGADLFARDSDGERPLNYMAWYRVPVKLQRARAVTNLLKDAEQRSGRGNQPSAETSCFKCLLKTGYGMIKRLLSRFFRRHSQ